MGNAFYETINETNGLGITISYLTTPGGYHPLHWHEELELLYNLYGDTDINVEGKKYHLLKKHLMVVEACQVHSTYTHDVTSMFLCIHISKKRLQQYFPGIGVYQIQCYPQKIPDNIFPQYLELCKMLETLTRLYIKDVPVFEMESHGILLQIFAHLLRHFSTTAEPDILSTDPLVMERIRHVISYVEKHFKEPVSLSDVSGLLGLNKEYFCRFFKKTWESHF